MKLPVKQILSKNKKHYQIVDSDNKLIIPELNCNSNDSWQIEEAINKYPIVRALLIESLTFMNQVPNNKYGNNYEICSKIQKILK